MKNFFHNYFGDTRKDPDPYIRYDMKMFSWQHIVLTLIVVSLVVLAIVLLYKSKSKKKQVKAIYALTGIMFGLEMIRYFWFFWNNGKVIDRHFWNLSLCSISVILLFFAVFVIKKQWMYSIVATNGILGGTAAFIVPLDVFDGFRVFHYIPVQSMFTHGLLFLIPVLMLISGVYRPKYIHLLPAGVGTFCMFMLARVVSVATGINHMITLSADEIFFLKGMTFAQYAPIVILAYLACLFVTEVILIAIARRNMNYIDELQEEFAFQTEPVRL